MYVEYDSSEKSTGLTHSLKKFLSPKNRNTQKKQKTKKNKNQMFTMKQKSQHFCSLK